MYPPIGIHYAWTSDDLILSRFDLWKAMKVGKGCTPPLAYIMHEHLIILFYSGLTWFDPKKTQWRWGKGCPPLGIHYAWTSHHLILFRFDMVWPKKHNEGGGRGVPPLGILYERRILWEKMGIWVSHAFQILVSFLFNRWSLLHGFGILLVPGSYWLTVKGRVFGAGESEGDTKGFDGVRVILYHIVIFCSFFWRRDRRGVAVWCCDMTLGIYRNDLESNPIHVQAGWNLLIIFHSCWFNGFRSLEVWSPEWTWVAGSC